ncbi:MAG: LPS export ABC transporter periplasmic protein LptC [Chitinophagaceae bacterium]
MLAKIKKHIIWAVLPGCFFISSCENDEKKVAALFEKKLGIDEATGIDSYMSQAGKMKAHLISPLMIRYQDSVPRMEFPKTLHVDFYDDTLGIQSKLDANFAQYFESQNKIFLKDSVRVFNSQGDTLFCQELWWDQPEARFHTDKPVRIHKPGTIIYGIGLTAPQDFKTFTMYKITNSFLRVKDKLNNADSAATTDTTRKKPFR